MSGKAYHALPSCSHPGRFSRYFLVTALLFTASASSLNSAATGASGRANRLPMKGTAAEPSDRYNEVVREISRQASADDLDNLEAVIETDQGEIVIEFFAKDAPRHVQYFIDKAKAGAYDGTAFHRLYKYGLIQGGDPLTRQAANKARFGTGGLNAGIPDEINKNKNIAGAVSAVLSQVKGNLSEVAPNSSGMQFFIVISPQPKLDSQFTVFGRVVSGLDTAAAISAEPAGASNMAIKRIAINKVTVRPKTPTVEQMKAMTAAFETTAGNFKVRLDPDSAPNTTRAFVRYAKSGLYDGVTFFRVSGKYYLESGNLGDWPAESPNKKRFFSLWSIPFEPNQTKQVRGTLSMRQINGTTNWDFYVISKDNSALDGKDVPIGKVSDGLDVIDKIAGADVDGDKPKERIEIKRITLE